MLDIKIPNIDPGKRKQVFIDHFNKLDINGSLSLFHNSDPKPLLLAVQAQIGSTITWKYEQNGPENWIVQVQKVPDPNQSKTMADLVAEDSRKADVFLEYGLDFCCQGNRKIQEACSEAGIQSDELLAQLMELDKKASREIHEYNAWPLSFLAEYIVNIYHSYVRKSLPELEEVSNKVYRVHGNDLPELKRIFYLLKELSTELKDHMEKEENHVFPHIYALSEAETNEENIQRIKPKFQEKDWHKDLLEEHAEAGDSMKEIRSLTNDYTLPQDACTAYSLLYSRLSEFEEYLYKHIHLENNILFPKALKLESKILK